MYNLWRFVDNNIIVREPKLTNILLESAHSLVFCINFHTFLTNNVKTIF